MRIALAAVALLSAFTAPVSASAETFDFSLKISPPGDPAQTLLFSLDPSTYTVPYFDYEFDNVTLQDGSTTEKASISIYPDTDADFLSVRGESIFASVYLQAVAGTLPVMGDPSKEAPTFHVGTYSGNTVCDASLRMPTIGPSSFMTLAMFELPTVNFACDDPVTLTVSTPRTPPPPPPPPSVTPEPSTMALLGTGALGVFGVVRRRFQ